MIYVRDYLGDQKVVRSERAPMQPVVSVVLPTGCRQAAGALQRALDSVLNQGFRDFELIVVDDGSTDGTWDYLRERQMRDPRLVLIHHDLNSGLPAIRANEGIELSRGRYLAFQFDDDEWLDGALETLVGRAESLSEPMVVYGDALLVFRDGRQERLPSLDVNLLTLFKQNRIANNSVLIPRSVVERFGLYDCHIAMRRICAWDLWVRYVRQVPFVGAGGLVSRAHVASDANALDLTAPYDLPLVRFLMALPRDELLSLARWRDYEVDSLSVAGVEIPRGFRHRLVAQQIRPYLERRRLAGSKDETPADLHPEAPSGFRTLMCLLDSCYPSTDLCFGHYDGQTRARRSYVRFEQLIDQIDPTWPTEADLLLLVRTVTGPTPEVAQRAVAEGLSSAYYLDDDLLSLHEYGPPFDNLAPGQAFHSNLVSALQQVNAVWTTSPVIDESVRPYNARIVPHNNAVPEAWLPARLRPRGAGGRVRIVHAGATYRVEEFGAIWEGLRQIAREFSDAVEFEFWGVDVSGLPALEASVSQVAYTYSYQAFMSRLRVADVDILLTPLLDRPRPRLAKSLCKYYDVAVAGAFGVFSDVPPYASLPHGLTCLKAANTPEAWYEAVREALRMPEERFDAMRRRLIEHVRLEFTETAQIHLHEAACRATEVHRRTRNHRHPDGRPRVLLVASVDRKPSPELQGVLRRYALEPVVGVALPSPGGRGAGGEVRPDDLESALGRTELEKLLEREHPALALARDERSVTVRVCRERDVPVAPGVPEVVVSRESFATGLRRLLEDIAPENGHRQRTVVAVKKPGDGFPSVRRILAELPGRLERVEFRVWGRPESERDLDCPEPNTVRWFDSGAAIDLSDVDVLVAAGAEEALLARAAAEGVLIVAASEPLASFPVDGLSGIVCGESTAEALAKSIERALGLSSEDHLRYRKTAYRAARDRVHPDAVANELFRRFNDVLEKVERTEARQPTTGTGPDGRRVSESNAKARLKSALDRVGLYRPLSRLSWRARRKRVLVVYENLFASERYHQEVLSDLEAATSRRWLFQRAEEVDPRFVYSFSAVFFVRGTSEKSLRILEAAKAFGSATAYDADDNLPLLHQVISDPQNEWRRLYDAARPAIEAMLRQVDVVKVYSEAAVPIFRRINPNVVMIHPYQLVTLAALPTPRREGPVTVGFLGSSFKDEEFKPLLPALTRLLDEGRSLRLEFFGFVPRGLAVRSGITVHRWEPDYRKYREKLDTLRWDIGLSPLRDVEYNRCKRNARYTEYAASGIAGIYSDARIYRDTVSHRKTGLIVEHESSQAWYDAIVELATDENLRTSIASQAFEDVRTNYRREDYVRRVADLLESLHAKHG